jgi:hypothetical protein
LGGKLNKLPQFQDDNKALALMQNAWASALNPLFSAQNQSQILENVALINGTTRVNHKLGRKLIGWHIVRQRASASIYDTQDTNPTPEIDLVLVSSANVTVNIEVF